MVNLYHVNITPKLITQGGYIELDYLFVKDPFLYKETDYLINNSPLKLSYMSDRLFKGEVVHPLDMENNNLCIQVNEKLKMNFPIYIPETIVGQFSQVDNNVFIDNTQEKIYFLDFKKTEDVLKPIICIYDLVATSLEKVSLDNLSINAIFLDNSQELYATSVKEKCIYQIDKDFQLTPYAYGLGSPFGMICNNDNQIFVADQKGSLFYIQNKQSIFLCDIPTSIKGYYLAIEPQTQNIYISTPSYSGINSIIFYDRKSQKTSVVLESYNLLGAIAFDSLGNLFWIEHTREESIIFYETTEKKLVKLLSGQLFMGLQFNESGDLFINDLHRIYKINKGLIYATT